MSDMHGKQEILQPFDSLVYFLLKICSLEQVKGRRNFPCGLVFLKISGVFKAAGSASAGKRSNRRGHAAVIIGGRHCPAGSSLFAYAADFHLCAG